MTADQGIASRHRLVPMRPRDPHEPERAASTLELFFDLVFVVAVSIAAGALHHDLTEGHVGHGVVSFALVFFAIWWAWMNFTWFATSFDTDDWLYRVLTVLQMGGVLVLAAGVEDAFVERDYLVVTLGYVVMRLAMVSQWLRAAHQPGPLRRTALNYAAGISLVQVGWLLRLLLPDDLGLVAFLLLLAAEISVPVLAERGGATTPWHARHITERYGLFTLILLGESLLASANAVIEAVHEGEHVVELGVLAALTLVITAALWWIYFWAPHHRAITGVRQTLTYGYAHYVVFAAAGAFSAGVEVVIDVTTDHSEIGAVAAALCVAVPVAVFVVTVWWVALRAAADPVVNLVVPLGAVLVLLDPLVPVPMLVPGVVLAAVVVVLVRHPPPAARGRGDAGARGLNGLPGRVAVAMSVSLENARILITGASSGIGAATARTLARSGARVALVARRKDRLTDLLSEITSEGGSGVAYAADVTDPDQVTGAVGRVVEDLGGLDALVGCAGYLANMSALGADLDEWRRMVAVNVDGVLSTTHAALPHLLEAAAEPRGVADVVTISSIAGRRVPGPSSQVYAATKHAVGAFSEGLRQELAERQVRVGLVEPGVVRTEMTTTGYTGAPDGTTGSPLEAEDVADAVHYILTRPAHAAVNEVLLRPTEQVR